jgi:hypothetical protein
MRSAWHFLPSSALPPVRIQLADRVQALDEASVALDPGQRRGAHPGHQPHVRDHVGRIGDLHAAARQRRIDRAHAVGNHVHGAAAHAAFEQRVHGGVAFLGRHPVVVRAGVVGLGGADEGQMLDPGDVVRMRAVQPAVRMGLFVEPDQGAVGLHPRDQRGVLRIAAVAPVDRVGTGHAGDRIDPLSERLQAGGRMRGHGDGVHADGLGRRRKGNALSPAPTPRAARPEE